MAGATRDDEQGYIDIYLLPVPTAKLDGYRRQASAWAGFVREHGGLAYREYRGEDLAGGLSAGDGEELMAAVVEFRSRAHRDEVMGRVMADPRAQALLDGEQPAVMEKMRYGGFEAFAQG